MTKPRKHAAEQEAEAERALASIRPDGEGWETTVLDGSIVWRREGPDGFEYASPQWDDQRDQQE